MAEIQVTLDASKLRGLVTKRTYNKSSGEPVEVQEVKFKLVEVKEPKTIFTAEKYRIDKTHFACVIQTKEERENKADTVYIGEGFTTIWDVVKDEVHATTVVDDDDLPF